MLKNNKGITLIALVITIIVLLILAGVSIAMLTGENGILTQAERSKEDTAEAEVADKINMALNGEFTNLLADREFTSDDPADIITNNGLDDTYKVTPASLDPDGTDASDAAVDVLTITKEVNGEEKTGKITKQTDGSYKIIRATYPDETTTTTGG